MKVKFNIINLLKDKSLYEKGMKPSVFSVKNFEYENIGWHRAGEHISYYKNDLLKKFNPYPLNVVNNNMNGKRPD